MKMQDQNKERENQDSSSNAASEPTTPIYSTGDSTLQTPDENRRDKTYDPRKNDRVDVLNDNLHETKSDRMAGSARAGTAERKDNQVQPHQQSSNR